MKYSKKLFTKIKILVIIFIILSFVSATYAWFTYMDITSVDFEVDVRAWSIEFKDGDNIVNNSIIFSSEEIYPGMEPITKDITITNSGDASAELDIIVNKARILDVAEFDETTGETNEQILDILAHDYPFKINATLSSYYLERDNGISTFSISISWPLDTGNDTLDSYWGVEAYRFKSEEQVKSNNDSSYIMQKPVELFINVKATQDVESSDSLDSLYQLGSPVLFDTVNNTGCTSISASCQRMYVIDNKNIVSDSTVTLIPDLSLDYQSSTLSNYNTVYNSYVRNWTVASRPLLLEDILNIVSTDIKDSLIKKETMSDIIIGNLSYENRMPNEIDEIRNYMGYYTFNNSTFDYLSTNSCIWTNTNYSADTRFIFNNDLNNMSIINESISSTNCKVVPIIIADKTALASS